MNFGSKVKMILDHQGLTQSKLAEKMGVTPQNISSILKQVKPHQKTIDSVASALGVSPNDLTDQNAVSVGERIRIAIVYLAEQGEVRDFEDVAAKCNIHVQVLYNLTRSPLYNIALSSIQTFSETFNISSEWILFGIGEMRRSSDIKVVKDNNSSFNDLKNKFGFESNATPLPDLNDDDLEIIKREDGTEFRKLGEERYLMTTPLVTEYAYGGYESGWADPEYLEEMPRHAIPVDRLHFGIYRSFTVRGDSMDNDSKQSISDGDIVTGRKVEQKYWKNKLHIHKFKDFVIHQESGIIIKRIIDHQVDEGLITYTSLNENKELYPDQTISLNTVRELYNIVSVNQKR